MPTRKRHHGDEIAAFAANSANARSRGKGAKRHGGRYCQTRNAFQRNQTTAEFRNEKTEDDTATVEMKDSTGIWSTVHFVKEDGAWKIDRKSEANKIEQEVEQKNTELDNIINQGRQP